MEKFKKTVLSLNVIGPMGDDSQEFRVGTKNGKTVYVQVGTVLIKDDGAGVLYINDDKVYTSETINNIAEDILRASKDYTNQTVETITSFEVVIVDKLPEAGEKGYIYFVPKDNSGGESSNGYNEWIYINDKWEEIGDTNFDLSDYYTSEEVDRLFLKKTGGTISGDVQISGDLQVKTIKTGDATIVLSTDPETQKTTITITGGTIYLAGDVNVNGTIYQKSGDIIQYSQDGETN